MNGAILKSPIVWGGGAVLGIILLMRGGGASAASVAPAMVTANPAVLSANVEMNKAVLSANVAMNTASLGAEIERARIAANLGATKFAADVADHSMFYDWMKTVDNNNRVVAGAQIEANAGITNSLIASSTAIIIDQANNANRLALGYQQVQIAEITTAGATNIAEYQYKGIKAASKNNMIGTAIGSIAKVATAALM